MPANPQSARPAFAPRTNTLQTPRPQAKLVSFLPTPPSDLKPKRRRAAEDQQPQKRQKVEVVSESEESDEYYEDDDDIFMEDASVTARTTRNAPYHMLSKRMTSLAIYPRTIAPSTIPILKSFVSSHKADIFKCQSIGEDTYLTPPYACAYSYGSKRGDTPHLAVATEQGTVHILNTSKRQDWDSEPQRTTLQPHYNGVFDVKWSFDDSSVATCSGDQSTRISNVETGKITHTLRGHNSTVKCMAWDPTNHSLLATGGRGGAICLWDIRVAERQMSGELELMVAAPVITIHGAHEDTVSKSKPKPTKGKQSSASRTVTNLLYPDSQPYGLVSSGSFDGILRYWDLRKSSSTRKSRTPKVALPKEVYASPVDPTTLHGSRRSRGIISLASGTGPSANLIFAMGADSRIHTYDLPTLTPQQDSFQHENLQTNSFYVGVSVSPCGRWLASGGGSAKGSSFLFDIENASRPFAPIQHGIELGGQKGEVGGVDWARDMLATCVDDGTVRIWRPDIETYRRCVDQPEERKWDWSWAGEN